MVEKRRILLVDDEPSIVKMISKRLEVEGFEVAVSMDGQEALNKARQEKPNLIILDLMLPKLNGYQICAMLKRDMKYHEIPIIMFTARAQEKDEKLGYESGADAYLRKPLKTQKLLDTIKQLLEKTHPTS